MLLVRISALIPLFCMKEVRLQAVHWTNVSNIITNVSACSCHWTIEPVIEPEHAVPM